MAKSVHSARSSAGAVDQAGLGDDLYRSIVSTAEDAYVAMDLDGLVIDWNLKAERLFGWPRQDVLGRPLVETIIPEAYREAHRDGLARFRETGSAAIFGRRVELSALHRDGHEFPVELAVWPVEWEGTTILNAFVQDTTQRVLARDRLHQSEERFRKLVGVAHEGIALQHDGVILEANPAFAAMFGVPQAELPGRRIAEFAGERFENLLVERERRDATDVVMASAERGDGTVITLEVAGHSILLDGKPARTVTLRDRTAEIDNQRRFELVFEECPLGIGLANPDFTLIRVNDALNQIFGYADGDLVGTTFVALTHPDDVPTLVEKASGLYSGKAQRFDHQCRGVRKNGDIITFQLTASVIKSADGEIRYAIGLVADVTERMNEQQLLDTFFAASADLLCIASLDGYLTNVNDAWSTALGWTSDELCAVPFSEFVHPDDAASTSATYESQIAAGEPVIHFENRYRCKDGSYRWLQWNAVTIPGQQIIVANARDTTAMKAQSAALRALNDELGRSNAELEQFAYVASHDLQEPLRMVASYVQLLQRRYQGRLDADADEFIGYAVDGANRMQSLIQDLLSYSRLGRKPRPFVPVDTAATVDAVLGTVAFAMEEADAVVRRGDLPVVNGDPSQLTQLFQNLIGNALKYRGKTPPVVEISAASSDNEWLFSVSDNGIGIDPAFKERIFNMFQRLHGRDEFSGTGIGLAIAKRVVDLHGGRIWVDPNDSGGSTFTFALPLRPMEVADAVDR